MEAAIVWSSGGDIPRWMTRHLGPQGPMRLALAVITWIPLLMPTAIRGFKADSRSESFRLSLGSRMSVLRGRPRAVRRRGLPDRVIVQSLADLANSFAAIRSVPSMPIALYPLDELVPRLVMPLFGL